MFGSEGDKVAGRLCGGGNQPKASNKQTNSGAAIDLSQTEYTLYYWWQ